MFSTFRKGMHRIRPGYKVDPCLWGETEGTSLLAAGNSIPKLWGQQRDTLGAGVTKAGDLRDPEDIRAAVWTILEIDPLAELDDLAKSSGRQLFNSSVSANDVAAAFRTAVSGDARVAAALELAGLEHVAAPSLEALVVTPVFQQLIGNPSIDVVDHIAPLSRALVAISMNELDEQLGAKASIDGSHRDEVVAALIDALGGDSRGIGTTALSSAGRLLLHLGILSPLEKHRAALVPKAVPAMGDVLKYLVRGEGLRTRLRACIADSDEDVVVLGHSLGGIAAVDLLVEEDIRQVVRLVTVGTQVGMLYEIDALPGLKFGQRPPNSFPRWDNIVDPRDLLAYSSQAVFPEFATDHYIDNKAPFPRNHSAYFGNLKFYSVLDEILP